MNLGGGKVLVTGGTGFIGGRLVEELVLGERCRVRALVRTFSNASRISPYPVEFVHGDLRDRESVERAVRGCDLIFHCAYDFVPDLGGQRGTGVEGTRNLAEVALAEGVDRIVHLSTVAVYQPLEPGEVTEESPWPPSKDPYVLVKREAEELLSKLHASRGLPVVTLQPTIVYGPFSDFWTLGPARRLRKGVVPLLNGGKGTCNAVYVDDVVQAMLLAATRPGVEGERFLISAEEPVTWRRFYEALEAAVGVRSTVEMSVKEVRQLIRARERKRRSTYRIMRRMREPRTWSRLGRTPMMRKARRILPDAVVSMAAARWLETEEGAVGGQRGQRGAADGPERRIMLPGDAAIDAETSKGRVRIDRAKERLGYRPRFDLDRGMEVTREYLEWAHLVGEA